MNPHTLEITIELPEPLSLNETWGAMPQSKFRHMQAPLWRWLLYWLCPLVPHPYAKEADKEVA